MQSTHKSLLKNQNQPKPKSTSPDTQQSPPQKQVEEIPKSNTQPEPLSNQNSKFSTEGPSAMNSNFDTPFAQNLGRPKQKHVSSKESDHGNHSEKKAKQSELEIQPKSKQESSSTKKENSESLEDTNKKTEIIPDSNQKQVSLADSNPKVESQQDPKTKPETSN
jgi:hypothetical protein